MWLIGQSRTRAMEMVASANGSPRMLAALNLAILRGGPGYWVALRRDGEGAEYVTMNDTLSAEAC